MTSAVGSGPSGICLECPGDDNNWLLCRVCPIADKQVTLPILSVLSRLPGLSEGLQRDVLAKHDVLTKRYSLTRQLEEWKTREL